MRECVGVRVPAAAQLVVEEPVGEEERERAAVGLVGRAPSFRVQGAGFRVQGVGCRVQGVQGMRGDAELALAGVPRTVD